MYYFDVSILWFLSFHFTIVLELEDEASVSRDDEDDGEMTLL